MTNARYLELELNMDAKLTTAERQEGWHFCQEFDFLCTQGEERDEFGRCVFCDFDGRKVRDDGSYDTD